MYPRQFPAVQNAFKKVIKGCNGVERSGHEVEALAGYLKSHEEPCEQVPQKNEEMLPPPRRRKVRAKRSRKPVAA